MKTFEELKAFMSIATTVHAWNELREQSKKEFTTELIGMLDASGYIKEVIL